MAVYGFGAAYGGSDDMTDTFIKRGGAFVGWKSAEAPFAHAMLRQIEVGDLVFLKSFPPSMGLIIKAAGIVTETADPMMDYDLGLGVAVNWTFYGPKKNGHRLIGKIGDKADFMRGGTLYREYNPDLQRKIIQLILGE